MNGRAFTFKRLSISDICGLHISPLGAVEGRKLRIIGDLTFTGDDCRLSGNDDTDCSAALPCELGHAFRYACRRILYLRQRHDMVARVTLCRIDVKDATSQFPQTICMLLNLVMFSASTPSWTYSWNCGGVVAPVIGIL